MACVSCSLPTGLSFLCKKCKVPYNRAWVVGERSGVLQRVIGLYKFERAKAAYRDLGDLMLEILPELPCDTIIVPIPTASNHVRERGYDHMLLIARYVAKCRGLKCRQLLERRYNTTQRHSSARRRVEQAKNAFVVQGAIDPEVPYLIMDDVVTTGATIKYAAKALRDSGAEQVWVAVLARQPLD